MKIDIEDYGHMKRQISLITPEERTAIRKRIEADTRVKDFSVRYRWDLAYAANLTLFICDLYKQNIDDRHVDTALKHIVRELNF